MENKLRHAIRKALIQAMEKPAIYMNYNDFIELKKEIEKNFEFFSKPNYNEDLNNTTYQGIPIKIDDKIEQGDIVVIDEYFKIKYRRK